MDRIKFKRQIHNLNNRLNTNYEYLNWQGPIKYPDLVRIDIVGDGSCFFHAIAKAYCKSYIDGVMDGKRIDRCKFIIGLRRDLAMKLSSKNKKGITYYDMLSNGTLKEFSKVWHPYKLENLKKELIECKYVDNVYIEFISNQINKDIYLLSLDTQDIYFSGDNYTLLHKGRNSIVLIYGNNHYELIGIYEKNGEICTLFEPDHPFILMIQSRIINKISNSNLTDSN